MVIGRGEQHPRRACGTGSPSKRGHIRGWGRPRWRSKRHHRNMYTISGVRICRLSEDPQKASHLQGKYPWTGEAIIIRCMDTKKDAHTAWKYTIISHAMSIRLVEGASEGCRPKLPRWPCSGSSCTQASGTAVHGTMVGSHARRVKLFSAAPCILAASRAASLVVTVLPPASFLTKSLHGPSSPHRLSSVSAPQQPRTLKTPTGSRKKLK